MLVYVKMMCRGPRPETPRDLPTRDPRMCNAVLNNVVGMAAFGIARNFDSGAAPHPCVSGWWARRRRMVGPTFASRPAPSEDVYADTCTSHFEIVGGNRFLGIGTAPIP